MFINLITGANGGGTGTAGVTSLNDQKGDLKLKTINSNDLLGEGNIEIQAGNENVITIRYGKDDRNIDAYNILSGYTAANDAVTVNLIWDKKLYSATAIWTSSTTKKVTFDVFLPGSLEGGNAVYYRFNLLEDGTCTIGNYVIRSIPQLTPYVYFMLRDGLRIENWTDNLTECGVNMTNFLSNESSLDSPLNCYCKVYENNSYEVIPFSIKGDANLAQTADWRIYCSAYSLGKRYEISATSWDGLKTTQNITYYNI